MSPANEVCRLAPDTIKIPFRETKLEFNAVPLARMALPSGLIMRIVQSGRLAISRWRWFCHPQIACVENPLSSLPGSSFIRQLPCALRGSLSCQSQPPYFCDGRHIPFEWRMRG
jgi:hypothetical protein